MTLALVNFSPGYNVLSRFETLIRLRPIVNCSAFRAIVVIQHVFSRTRSASLQLNRIDSDDARTNQRRQPEHDKATKQHHRPVLSPRELSRSEEHTSELQSHSFISYAVF